MNMIVKFICYLSFVIELLFTSCNKNTPIVFTKTKEIICSEIIGDLPLKVPGDFDILDSFLVIQDPFASEYSLQFYNMKNGALFMNGAKKGQGPLEILMPSNIGINGNSIEMYGLNLKKFCNYHFSAGENFLNAGVERWSSFENINKVIHLKGDEYVAISLSKEHPFSLINSKKNTQIFFGEYALEKDGRVNNFYDVFQGCIKSFNNGDSFVYAASNFPYISIFHKTDSGYQLKMEQMLDEPLYEMKNSNLSFKSKSITGFMDMAIGKNSIYLLHADVERSKTIRSRIDGIPKQLYEFDFDGKPLCQYELNMPMLRIACDNQGEVYGIGLHDDRFKVVKLNIKE